MTENELLDRQDALARHRLGLATRKLGRDLDRATGLNRLIREHPLISLGVGAAAGYLVGDRMGAGTSGARRGLAGRAVGLLTRPIVITLRSAAIAALFGELRGGDGPSAGPDARPGEP